MTDFLLHVAHNRLERNALRLALPRVPFQTQPIVIDIIESPTKTSNRPHVEHTLPHTIPHIQLYGYRYFFPSWSCSPSFIDYRSGSNSFTLIFRAHEYCVSVEWKSIWRAEPRRSTVRALVKSERNKKK
jgi:hypothetical protein